MNALEAKTETHLAGIIEQNIRAILEIRGRSLEARSAQERISDGITAFSGRMSFLYLHAVRFGVWIFVSLGWTGLKPVDLYAFGLLTMIVWLEAIFLATFVLISQIDLTGPHGRQSGPSGRSGLADQPFDGTRDHAGHSDAGCDWQ